jgi:uncharacterized surface protein with fasciclin (FAS1) repeats
VGGATLAVTQTGNDLFVNGVKIIKSNVIAKNGVVHYMEKVCSDPVS